MIVIDKNVMLIHAIDVCGIHSSVFQEGFTLCPPDFRFIVDGVKGKTLQNDYFWLGDGKCKADSGHSVRMKNHCVSCQK
jgi:phage major head subunit gpT-like protein